MIRLEAVRRLVIWEIPVERTLVVIASEFIRVMITGRWAHSTVVLFGDGIGRRAVSATEDGTVRAVKVVLGA